MTSHAKTKLPPLVAVWRDCPGIFDGGPAAHEGIFVCELCHPWWCRVPCCPACGCKARKMGHTRCTNTDCGVWFTVERDPKGA